MELRQLSYFITIVNEGTISAAAKKLHISQPPLSHQMKLLEEELGVLLFERGARSIRLTVSGQAFYEKAMAILNLTRLAAEEAGRLEAAVTGTLKLGVVSSVGEFLLHQYLIPFHRNCPQVSYELYESDSYHLLEQVASGTLDLAVVRTPFPQVGFECRSLPPDPFLAVGRPECWSEIPKVKSISLAELASLPLILYKRWEQLFMDYFNEHSIRPNLLCRNEDARTTLLWAKNGLGIALVPASALYHKNEPDLICLPLSDPPLESSICLIKKEKKTLSSAARTFYEQFL
ncbi:MAG: LysR family transcriptional regulator [Clostridium sp.]|nr:LysR family transcriptional regulator [Clostridium sp.]